MQGEKAQSNASLLGLAKGCRDLEPFKYTWASVVPSMLFTGSGSDKQTVTQEVNAINTILALESLNQTVKQSKV